MSHEIPYYYLFIYSKLKSKIKNDSYLPTQIILQTIRNDCKTSKMPHNLLYHILSQMEDYGLLKRIHRFKYKIIQGNKDEKYFEKRNTFPLIKFKKKDEFQKIIESINEQGKVKCEDDCLYKILPSKELKKLNNLNCWFMKS